MVSLSGHGPDLQKTMIPFVHRDTDTVKIEKVEIVHDSGHLTLITMMMWSLMSSTVG